MQRQREHIHIFRAVLLAGGVFTLRKAAQEDHQSCVSKHSSEGLKLDMHIWAHWAPEGCSRLFRKPNRLH